MYIQIDQELTLRDGDIVGFFDLDNTSASKRTQHFLNTAEQEGRITLLGNDIPSSFVLTKTGNIYLTRVSTKTLRRR